MQPPKDTLRDIMNHAGEPVPDAPDRVEPSEPSGPDSLKKAALEYADAGTPVFPLHNPITDGCSCGKSDCNSAGKHPRTAKGFKNATTDVSTIEKWWSRWPDANIGVPTGKDTGRVILDVDFRHDGKESLAQLEERFGSLPATRTDSHGKWAPPRVPVPDRLHRTRELLTTRWLQRFRLACEWRLRGCSTQRPSER